MTTTSDERVAYLAKALADSETTNVTELWIASTMALMEKAEDAEKQRENLKDSLDNMPLNAMGYGGTT